MFRKDEEALAQWSEANVELCSARQRRILADVWPALSENGYLIYSTCTFNKYENDGNVAWAAEELGAEVVNIGSEYKGLIRTEHGVSLVPGFVEGEGQYCSALMKTSSAPLPVSSLQKADKKQVVPADAAKKIKTWFNVPVTLTLRGDMIVAVPEHLNSEIRCLEGLRPLLRGVAVGQLKGKDIVPDADLALSSILERGVFVEAELTKEQALAFLHKDSLTLTGAEKGIVLVTYLGHPLGFVKNLGNRCNNLHPQGRRIRMNI